MRKLANNVAIFWSHDDARREVGFQDGGYFKILKTQKISNHALLDLLGIVNLTLTLP